MSKLILKAIPANATSAAADKTVGNIDTAGSTQRLTLQAQPKTQYRLVDAKTGEVVKNQTVLRHGKQLQVMVDGVNAVELDNFFPEEAVNAAAPADSASYLVDTGAAGAPSYGVVSAQTPMEVSANGVSTLWTPGMPALPLVEPVAFGAPALAAVSASSAGGLAAGLGLAAAAGGGGGGGGGSSSSTSSAKVTGVCVKAEVASNSDQLRVAAFDTTGTPMGEPVRVDKDGKYVFVLKDTTFTGTLVLKMYDVDPDDDIKPTFYDEATGDTKDFTKPLYAVVNYGEAGKEVKVNITPLTNLAATVAGVDTKSDKPTLSGTAAETEKLVKEANTKVAQKFGLNEADLTAADVKTTNSDQANDYGVALAIMSKMEQNSDQDKVAKQFKEDSSTFTTNLKQAVSDLKASAGTNNDYLKNIDTSKLDKVSEVASDTTAPVLVTTGTKANTNIDGTKVYLHFDSELSKNTADKSQFTLEVTTKSTVDGVADTTTTPAISSVAIDGNDVVLTLATKIAKGQTVKVSYNDPTANTNDLLAVQDVAGNDAASINATDVTNNVTEVKPVITVDASQIFDYEENQTTKGGFEAQVQASATEGVTVTKFRFADSQASISKDGWYSIDKDGNISLTNVGLSAGKASNDFETKLNGGNALVYGVQAGDNAGNWSDSVNITLNVTNVADAPSVKAPVSFTVLEDVASNLEFAKDAFADPDSTNLTVTLNVKDDFGTLSYDAVKATAANITVTPSGKTFAFNGKTSDLNAFFSTAGNLKYQDAANFSGTRTLNIKVSDDSSPTALSKSITSNIKVTAVNDAPAGTDKTLTILEEGSKTFAAADFGLTDASDSPANSLSAVIITSLPAADAGSLKLNNVAVTPNQSIAAADLGKLVYTPAVNGSGDAYASIGFKVQDNGGTANDGKNTSANANTLTINVTPVNDAPTLTATAASPTFTEGSDPVAANSQYVQGKAVSVFSAASINTIEAGQTITSLTFTVSGLVDGKGEKISIDGVTIPLVIDEGSIKAGLNYDVSITNSVATVVLTMDTGLSASDAQALINSIKYQNTAVDNPTEGNRVFTLTQIQDNGGTSNSGVDTSTLNVGSTVKVVAVNDAPVNSMDPIDVEANIKTFILNGDGEETQTPNTSQFAFNDLSISDVDARDGTMSVTLSVTNGSLAHTDFDGVSFTEINKRSFKASGSLTILNEWLASEDLKYTPDEDFVGTDKLTMLTNDGGNTGSGGEKTASSTADLNVNDTAGPTLLKVETDENNGAIIYMSYSEALDATNIPSKDDFALTVKVTADKSLVEGYSVDSVSVTDRVVTLRLNKALQVEQSVSLAYTLNGDTALVQDVKGNDADSIEDASVIIKVPDLVNPVVTPNQILSYGENQVADAVVDTVRASDNVRVTGYRFVNADGSFSDTTADGNFKIDKRGQISITDAGARSAYNNYESEDRSVVYAVQALDAKGNVSEAVDVRLNVDDVNEIPVAQSYALLPDMDEDKPIEFTGYDLRAAASDPENQVLKFQISGVTSGTLKKWVGSAWLAVVPGDTVVESTEKLQWTPPADVNRIDRGQIEAFKVKAIDDPFTTNEIPIKVVISPANDAPTVVSSKASVTLPAIDEDASSITGATVSSLFSASFSDAKDNVSGGSSANTLSGIAITGNAATATQGTWQWSANGSTNWTDIPNDAAAGTDAPTNTHVYYLRADASLRFAPATDFNGAPGALTTHLVESSWPTIGNATNGLRVDNPEAQYYTADAVTLSTSVTSVNDAPTGTDGSITIDEDGSKTFSAADFGFEDAKDSPVNTLSAVIITSLPAVGSLKLDNVDVTLNQSIAATDLDKLVYAPAANGNGDSYASIGFKVQDNGSGATDTSVSANTLTINVTPVNDKPTVVDGKSTVTLPSIEEDQDPTTYSGAKVSDLFGASFSDDKDGALAKPFVGIGITDMASTAAQGNWQYQSGGTWYSIDYSGENAPSPTNVLVFTASTPLRFKPAANFSGTPGGLKAYLIEDNSSGLYRFPDVNGDFFSADPVTLTTTVTAVNDAPKNTVPLSAVSVTANIDTYDLAGVKQTYTPKAITGLSVTDVDAGTSSMSVTLSVTNGSLAHNTRSGSGVTFTDTSASSFTASGNQDDLNAWLASTGGVSYTPTANSVSGDTLTMLTNDGGNSGSGGEKTDTDSVTLNVSDTRAPVLLKAETSTDGLSIVLTYDEALDSGHKSTSSQYSLAVTDAGTSVAVNITGVSVDNLGRTVTLTLSQAVQIQQVVKLNYSDPSGNTTDTVQDISGNDALSFNNQPITIKVPDIVKPTVTTTAALPYNENQTAGAVVGTVTADDNVGVTGYRFASADGTSGSATSADGYFSIASDGKVSITATGAAAGAASNDFETSPNSFTYAIQATDGTNWSDSVNVTLNLKNVDEAGSIGAITNTTDGTRGTSTLQQGDTLTAGAVTDPDGGVTGVSYQWKAGGSNVGTGTSYTLTQADVRKAISVVATYTDLQGSGKTVTSSQTSSVVDLDDAGSIAITNTTDGTRGTSTLQQGDTLTAGTITDPDGGVTGITYQWKAGGSNVGTNAATYTLTQADVGKAISVVASYGDAQGGNKTATSSDTSNVVNVNDAPTLTTITKLTGFTEDTYKEISYQDLVDAADENDVDTGDTIKFRIESVSTGTLQKLSGSTWADVTAGTTTVATGEKLQWKAAQDANGNGLNAFTVKAVDTLGAASSTAVQVKADVGAVNDKPIVVAAQSTVTLAAIQEDQDPSTYSGATIDSLFRGSFSDAKDNVTGGSSANAFFAIGVTNVASTDAQGNWEYKDNSGNWVPIANSGGPSLSNVYYFVTSTPLRFKPAANFSGTPGGLTAYLIEQNTSGRTGFDNVNYDFFSANSVTLTTSVTAVNDAPTLTATASNPSFVEGGGASSSTPADPVSVFSAASISTVESGQNITGLTFTVSGLVDGANEKISVDGTPITLGASSSGTTTNSMVYTVTVASGSATVALTKASGITTTQAQTLVNGITYQNALVDTPTAGNRVFTLTQVKDSGGGISPNVDTTTLTLGSTVTVTPVNDTPTVTAPNAFTVTEDTSGNLQFTGTPFADVDSTNLTVTLSIADGTISATSSGSVTVGGTPIARTFAGTAAALNTFFITSGNIKYTGAQDANGTRTLTTKVDDGAASNNTATTTSTITITAANDAPTVTAPTTFTVNEDTAVNLVYNGAPFADVDSTNLTVTLSITDGTISATGSGSVTVGGTPTARTFAGTAAALNTFFTTAGNITYTGAQDANGTRTLTTKVDDGASSNNTVTTTSTINITAVNDKPTVVAAQSTVTLAAIQEDPVTNTGATIGSLFGASFSDAKDGSSANAFFAIGVTNVASTDTQGNWEFKDNSGNWVPIANSGGPSLTNVYYFVASTPLRFKPAANFSGTPGGLTAYLIEQNTSPTTVFNNVNYDFFSATSVTLNTSVTAVNDVPVRTGTSAAAISVNEDSANSTAVSLGLSGYSYGPGGGGDEASQTLTYAITNIPTSITLWKTDGSNQVFTTTTGLTQADIQGLKYKTVAEANNSTAQNITWTVTDSGTGSNSITESLSVTVAPVNDAPSITPPSGTPPGANAGVAYSIAGGFTIADVDAGSSPVQVNFQVLEGSATDGDVLNYGTLPSGVTLVGNTFGTNHVYSFQGTISALNAWMLNTGFLKFTSTSVSNVTAIIKTSVNDLGNTGGLALSTNGTSLTVDVTSDNTPPTVTVTSETSSNATNTVAKAGDVITVLFNTNEAVGTPTVTIGGKTATVSSLGGNNYKATYAVVAGDTGATAVVVNAKDAAGNTSTVNLASNVTMDNTPPTVSVTSETSSNATNTLAKAGDVITVAFTSTDTVTGVTIGGKTATVTSLGGNNYKATYAVVAGDTGATAVVVNAKDAAGNTSTVNLASNVTMDNTPPTVSVTSETSNNATNTLAKLGDVITVAFTSTDTVTGVTIGGKTATVTSLGGNNYKATYTVAAGDTGATAVVVNATDLAGNPGTGNLASNVTMDTTPPPVPTADLASDTGISTDRITNFGQINVYTTGDTVSWQYSTNSGNTWANGYGTGSGGVGMSVDAGVYSANQVQFKAFDAAGNSSVTSLAAFTVDTTGPTAATLALAADTGRDNSDGITNNGKINVTTGADTVSWKYTTNNGVLWTNGTGSSFVVPDGKYAADKIQVKALDIADNPTVTKFGALTVDLTGPQVIGFYQTNPDPLQDSNNFNLIFDYKNNNAGWNFDGDNPAFPLSATVNGTAFPKNYSFYSSLNSDGNIYVELGGYFISPSSVVTISYTDPHPGVADTGDNILIDSAGNESPSFTVNIGGTADDNLVGANVNNFFFGGGGNDTMTGGTANDTYIWQKGDAGAFGSSDTVIDTIKNFSPWNSATLKGDKLNIAALLDHTTYPSVTGSGFFTSISTSQTVNGVSNCTVITLNTNGSAPGGPTQKIVLEGVNLMAGTYFSSPTPDSMATYLIDKGVLIA